MIRALILAVVLLAGFAERAAGQWSLAAFGGNVSTAKEDLRVTSAGDDVAVTVRDVPYDDQSSRSPVYYGGRLTRFFESVPWLGLEAEFIHLKVITAPQTEVAVDGRLAGQSLPPSVPLGTVLPRFELSHGLNLLLGNVVVRLPLGPRRQMSPTPRVGLTLRGGAGPTVPHVEVTFRERDEDGYRLGRIAWHAAAGIEMRLWRRLHAVSEVKWTTSRQHLQAAGAQIDGTFRSRHIVAGLSWSLSPAASDRHRPFMRDASF